MKDFLQYHGSVFSIDEVIARNIPDDVLMNITPRMIVDYFQYKAYGSCSPGDEDRPVCARSSTLFFYKKALSSFMFLQNSQWDDILMRGNPTKSKEVNDMIKKVVKHEVRHEGVSSKARRGLEYKEYLLLLKLIRKNGFVKNLSMADQLKWTKLYSLLTMQWQLIARMDDMVNLHFENITTHLMFPFSIRVQMRWSKNIVEEREVPEQVVLPSMEECIDPILGLAIYLETSRAAGELLCKTKHVFGGEKARHTIRRLFDTLVSHDDFQVMLTGLLGNHSVRKGAATFGMRSGLSRDHTNRRGRWRIRRQVVDVYIDNNLPYPDALAASKLCGVKGACKYKISQQVEVSNNFILEKVVPEASRLLGEAVAIPLGHALLWASFYDKNHPDDECPLVPEWLRDQVVSNYEEMYGSLDDCDVANPVQRCSVTPQGNGDQVSMVELDFEEADTSMGGVVRVRADGVMTAEATSSLLAHQVTVQRQVEETKQQVLQELYEMRNAHRRQYDILTRNLKRIAVQPVVRQRLEAEAAADITDPQDIDDLDIGGLGRNRSLASLYRCPKTLFDLWHEFQFGLAGSKPAKEFTSEERGKNKSVYSRRKVFWDCITKLVNAGFTSDVAIDKVYECYGRGTSVTKILLLMIRDRKDGGHPTLRVGL